MQSYIINGVRSAKSPIKMALFQPLTQLDLVSKYNIRSDLQRLSEIRCTFPYQSVTFDYRKICISAFITELLYKTLPQENSNPELFDFLIQSFIHFDQLKSNVDSFHIKFMIHLFPYLGFEPSDFQDILSHSTHSTINSEILVTDYLTLILSQPLNLSTEIPVEHCKTILTLLVDFLMFNMPQISAFKSIAVIKEL